MICCSLSLLGLLESSSCLLQHPFRMLLSHYNLGHLLLQCSQRESGKKTGFHASRNVLQFCSEAVVPQRHVILLMKTPMPRQRLATLECVCLHWCSIK